MKTDNRKYMEAIREMVNTKQGINTVDILKKHGVPVYSRWSMNKLGWVQAPRGRGSSTKWVGPKPSSEADLLRMAVQLRDNVKAYNERNKKYKKPVKSVAAGPVTVTSAQPVTMERIGPAPVSKPRKAPQPRKREVSLLWGAIKWTR